MARERILVTGGSGFLGKAFIERKIAAGAEVVSLGRTALTASTFFDHAAADLSDPASLRAALACLKREVPFDSLVHLAVSRHHREFPQKALDLFHVNTTSAVELLEFARTTGIKRVVLGSTGSVYSSNLPSTDEVMPGDDEETWRVPSSFFAASKLMADTMAEFYRASMPVSVLRFYVPYGPGLRDRMLNDLICRVQEGHKLSLPSNGPGLAFSAVHLEDAIAVMDRALAEEWNEAVNVAAPEVWTITSAAMLIGRLVSKVPTFERSLTPFAPRIVPSVKRLQALMPGCGFLGLEAGLRSMIAAESQPV
jgi:nucleoside-diphosphate-sugar epimerase